MTDMNRRTMLRRRWRRRRSRPLVAGPRPRPTPRHRPRGAARQTAQRTATRATRRSSSPRTSGRRSSMLVDLIIPKDEQSGSATDAGVPEFMDFMMVDQPTRQIADARRPGVARSRVQHAASTRRSSPATDAERRAVLDDISWPRRAKPGIAARRHVLQQLPRPDRERVLHDEDRHPGSRLHRQHLCPEMDGLPASRS